MFKVSVANTCTHCCHSNLFLKKHILSHDYKVGTRTILLQKLSFPPFTLCQSQTSTPAQNSHDLLLLIAASMLASTLLSPWKLGKTGAEQNSAKLFGKRLFSWKLQIFTKIIAEFLRHKKFRYYFLENFLKSIFFEICIESKQTAQLNQTSSGADIR
jgi:hypothetical protein